jgi:hypothetical protein
MTGGVLMAPVAGLQNGDVVVWRVGHEALEAVSVQIREGELAPGWGEQGARVLPI